MHASSCTLDEKKPVQYAKYAPTGSALDCSVTLEISETSFFTNKKACLIRYGVQNRPFWS